MTAPDALLPADVLELLSLLQPIVDGRDARVPSPWWFMDYLERDCETRTPLLVIGDEYDVAVTLLAPRINKKLAAPIVQALARVPDVLRALLDENAALRAAAAQSKVRDTVFEAAKAMYLKVQTNPDSVEESCHYVSIERDDSGFDAFWNTLRAALEGEGTA